MSQVAIIGFASLDHVVILDGRIEPGRTTLIRDRPIDAWPRFGGSPAFMSQALSAAGIARPAIVSWVGVDAEGANYCAALSAAGADTDAIVRVPQARTPSTLMVYEADGSCACLYDPLPRPGDPGGRDLTERQRNAIVEAGCVCFTIGPPDATAQALALCRPDAVVAWVAKHDAASMPMELATAILARADIVFASRAEAGFAAAALGRAPEKPGRILVETSGADGASITRGINTVVRPAPRLNIVDPSGAGDTLAGATVAALLAAPNALEDALDAGMRAAHRMLQQREMNMRTVRNA